MEASRIWELCLAWNYVSVPSSIQARMRSFQSGGIDTKMTYLGYYLQVIERAHGGMRPRMNLCGGGVRGEEEGEVISVQD